MKRIIDNGKLPETPIKDPPISDISVDDLVGKCLLALNREVTNLLMLSAKGKLDAGGSRDLRETTKLLFELKDREKEFLESLGNDDLKRLNTENL